MKIIISNIIVIKEPTKKVLDFVTKELTFTNPEYTKKQKMGFYNYGTPKYIKLYDIYEDDIYIPIGMFEKLWKIHPHLEDYIDNTVVVPVNIKSNIVLRDYQVPAVKAVKEHYNGIISLKVGTGKTQCALQSIVELGQKTLFMAHTIDLVNQAKTRCEDNLKCTTSLITNGKLDKSGDIVFGTVQTVLKFIENGKLKQDDFGMIVLDECFPKGTKINTPNGYKNIEDIKIGDIVYSYNHTKNIIEEKQVNYLFNKNTSDLLDIKLSNGKIITCTRNHPIYVNGAYIRADEIKQGDVLYEMQPMWTRNNKGKLYRKCLEIQDRLLQTDGENILFKGMFKIIQSKTFSRIWKIGKKQKTYVNSKPDVSRKCEKIGVENIKRNETQANYSRWKRQRTNYTTNKIIRGITKTLSECGNRVCCSNKRSESRVSQLLQNRHCYTRGKNSNRGRRFFPLFFKTPRARQEENTFLRKVRVESIEVQKQGSNGKLRGSCEVYNIGVLDNNNYFVDGVLVHNCQHISANPKSFQIFRKVVEYFAARYKVGLSAEVHRADGLQNCIKAILGDIIYGMEQVGKDYICVYEGKELMRFPTDKFQVPCRVIVRDTDYNLDGKEVFDEKTGTIIFAALISDIAMNKERNNMILRDLKQIHGSTIVLSDRVEQLKFLCKNIDNGVQIDGETPKKIRNKALEDMRNGKIQYLFASYALAKEGLDIPMLTNLVMATPVKDFGVVVQSCGRIQRPYDGKKIATVFDYVDNVGMLLRFFSKRRNIYKKHKWTLEDL